MRGVNKVLAFCLCMSPRIQVPIARIARPAVGVCSCHTSTGVEKQEEPRQSSQPSKISEGPCLTKYDG